MRRAYVINVCMTCGAHAVYPFVCGHRPDVFDPQSEPWTVPITVEATASSMAVLDAIKKQATHTKEMLDMSFTCPRCGMTSYHPVDEREGYCARCRDFTEERTKTPPSRSDPATRAASDDPPPER